MVLGLGIGEGRNPLLEVAIDIAANEGFGLHRPQIQGVQPLELVPGEPGLFEPAEIRIVDDREVHTVIIPQDLKKAETALWPRAEIWLRYISETTQQNDGPIMSDLLQEIDSAIKQEKAEKFWRENGPYIIGGALALIALTGIFTAWNSWQLKIQTRQTGLLVSAMETPYPETALAAATQALDGKHKAMAQIQSAGLQAQKGESEAAIALYKTVAADRSAPAIWRDLATLMAVRLEWNSKLDQEKAKSLYNDLKPLLSDKNPWHLHAALQSAMIAGDSLGEYKAALGTLSLLLNNPQAPQSLKDRARALDHLYAMKLSAEKPAAKTPTPAEPKG